MYSFFYLLAHSTTETIIHGGGNKEEDNFDEGDELMIVMVLRWDLVFEYQWEMKMTDGND